MKFTYLLIDLFSVLLPFIFSFHPSLKFYRKWPAFFPAVIIAGLVFIGWDMYFTHLKIWGFNGAYLTGVYVGNLPVEEILFFICIPYACVFTYACLKVMIIKTMAKRSQLVVSCILIVLSVFMTLCFHSLRYTSFAFGLLALLLFTAEFILKANWLSRFYLTYLILLLPFVIVNGLLTGTGLAHPIVWYNPAHITGPHILTIPVEDIFYGMDLILLNVMIYTELGVNFYKRRKNSAKAHHRENQLNYTHKIS